MNTIWKYPVKMQTAQTVEVVKSFKPISAAMQDDQITIWGTLDDTDQETRNLEIRRFGTGHNTYGNPGTFIDTVHEEDGHVWHIFYIEG